MDVLYSLLPFEHWSLNFAVYYVAAIVLTHLKGVLFGPGFDVKGKHVFITGGSTGLGLALAQRYAKAGAYVTIVARTASKLEAAVESIQSQVSKDDHSKIQFRSCDVTNEAQIVEAVLSAAKAFQTPVDILVTCAGSAHPGYFEDLSLDDHRRQFELNYMGTLAAIKAVYPSMSERKQGHIVMISSAICFAGMIGYSAYAPSKFALRGLADCLRSEFKCLNIKVTAYFPANILTPGFEEENRLKPTETAEIEGTSPGCTPEVAADVLIEGIKSGCYGITNNLDSTLGMIASRGVAPPNNLFLESLIAPFLGLIATIFTATSDAVAIKAKLGLKKNN